MSQKLFDHFCFSKQTAVSSPAQTRKRPSPANHCLPFQQLCCLLTQQEMTITLDFSILCYAQCKNKKKKYPNCFTNLTFEQTTFKVPAAITCSVCFMPHFCTHWMGFNNGHFPVNPNQCEILHKSYRMWCTDPCSAYGQLYKPL